jgi:hypothetical protein
VRPGRQRTRSSGAPVVSPQQALAQELSGKLVGIALVTRSATADGDDEHGDLSPLDAIDDAIELADGTDTAEFGELTHERLVLVLGRCAELIGALKAQRAGTGSSATSFTVM